MKRKERRAIFADVHKVIAESAELVISSLGDGEPNLCYPPGAELSDEERTALRKLKLDSVTVRALASRTADQPCFVLRKRHLEAAARTMRENRAAYVSSPIMPVIACNMER